MTTDKKCIYKVFVRNLLKALSPYIVLFLLGTAFMISPRIMAGILFCFAVVGGCGLAGYLIFMELRDLWYKSKRECSGEVPQEPETDRL